MRLPLVPLMCLSCALCQPTRRRTAPDPAASTETQHERGEPCSITPPPTHLDATRRHDAHAYVSTYATTTNTSPLIGRLAAARAAARHAMSSQPKARAVCSVPRPAVPLCLESCEKLEAGSYAYVGKERSNICPCWGHAADHACVGAFVHAESATAFSGMVWNKTGISGTQMPPI